MVLAFVFGAWTLPGLLYTYQIYELGLQQVFEAGENTIDLAPTTPLDAMLHALPVWWIWVPATPLVIWLTRRFPLGPGRRPYTAVFHVAASIAVALVVVLLSSLWFAITGPFEDRIQNWSWWVWALTHSTSLHLYILSYWLIVGATFIVDSERRSRRQQLIAAQKDALVARSQVQALAHQLQPHFLFNSLNAVSTLILRKDNDAALRMVGSLADFLRETLRVNQRDLVPLHDELALLDKYLSVEQVRWGDRLRVDIDVSEAAGRAHVPVLLLQPLVENAIRHGIAERESGGTVSLRARVENDRVWMAVENDGAGLPTDWGERAEQHVGLRNTRQRLAQLFGDDFQLRLEDLVAGRVRAWLEIPYVPIDREAALDVSAPRRPLESES